MKTNLFITMAASALLLVACNNEENTLDSWKGEIRLSSGICMLEKTRAGEAVSPHTQIAQGQLVGVYVAKTPETNDTEYHNVCVKADGAGNFTDYSETMYYPYNNNQLSITAYHPFNGGDTDTYDFAVNKDQRIDTDYYNSDLLVADVVKASRQTEAVALKFKHQLSNVRYKLRSSQSVDADALTGAVVSIVNAQINVAFNRTTGTVSAPVTKTKSDIVLHPTYGAVLPPQSFAQGSSFLKVQLTEGEPFFYQLPSNKELEKATTYTYSIKVNKTGISATVFITPWDEQEAVEDEADAPIVS